MITTTNSRIRIFAILLLVFTTSVCFANKGLCTTYQALTDSARVTSTAREVLTSQQLFVVKISPIKNGNAKPARANFKAELRDAYQIISYNSDGTSVATAWIMCPGGKCPLPGTYDRGTAGYKQLDSLVAKEKTTPNKK